MNLIFAVFLQIILLYLTFGFLHANETEFQFIVDMSRTYEAVSSITAFLCWEPNFRIKLNNKLRNLERPISIKFIRSRPRMIFFEYAQQHSVFIANLNCPGVGYILRQAQEANENIFNKPFRWLIIEHGGNRSRIPPDLLQMNIFMNSEVIVAKENGQGDFDLQLVYRRVHEEEWLTEHFGVWSAELGLMKSEQIGLCTVLRRRNLARRKIAVAFNVDDKETGVGLENCDSRIRNSRHSVTQWGFQHILPLYDFMNATRYNIFTDDWGYYVNGSWNGIVRLMFAKEAELSGTPIFLVKERLEVMRYLINPVNTDISILFREPPLSYQNNLFLLPFSKTVWCTLAGLILILMAVIYANVQWELKKLEIILADEELREIATNKMTLSDVVMMIVGAATQQGSFTELRGTLGRSVMFTLFLAFLFLFTAYSASIVVLLQSTSKQIRTLSDLLNSKLDMGVENTSYNVYYFTRATDPVRKAIYQTKIAPRGTEPKFMSTEEGFKKLHKGPFAFHMDLGVGYKMVSKYFYEHEKCGLKDIPYLAVTKPWLTCRKGSPYEELIKIGLYRIHEHGISHRANSLVYTKKPVCSVRGGNFDSVSIVDVYPPFTD